MCEAWMYDSDGNQTLRLDATGTKKVPVPRVKGTVTPCFKCPKIPQGAAPCRASAIEMSTKNRMAFLHYQECRAVGSFPDDSIVRRNARIIRDAYDDVERSDMMTFQATIGALVAVSGAKRA